MPFGIFGEISKDVGELQRATEFRSNTLTGLRLLTEDPH